MDVTGRGPSLAEQILALHMPTFDVAGAERDFTVYAGMDVGEDHVCRVGGVDACSPEEHYALACVECRGTTEDGEPGYPFWPCPTARLAMQTDDQP